MKDYILTEDKIEDLRECLDPDMGHSAFWIRNEIRNNILPELFEKSFKVGKYYEYVDEDENIHFVFKLTELKKLGDLTLLWGYGLDFIKENVVFEENCSWIDDEDTGYLTEITQKEFMEHIKTYAIEELGFKKDTVFNGTNMFSNLAFKNSKIKGDIEIGSSNGIDYLECDVENGLKDTIFQDGKFAEIIEEPKKKYDKVMVNFEEEIFQNLIEVLKTTKQGKNIDFSETTKVEINRI